MKRPIVHILLADVTAIRVSIGMVAILFCFGLLFADVHGGSYNKMLEHANRYVWAGAFFAYGISKFFVATQWPRPINKVLAYLLVMSGIYLWLFTFLSFVENPNRPLGSADAMVLWLTFAEVWVGAHTLADAS